MSGAVFWPNGSTTKPRITGSFGPRAPIVTPGGVTNPFHYGTDMVGFSDICAPVDGVVTFAAYNGGFGNFVRIAGDNGDDFGHAHIAPNGFYVSKGQRVRRGQPIARMGTTGRSTGVHLHWEVYRGRGAAVNAETYMQSNAAPAGGGATPFEGEEMDATERNALLSTHAAMFYGGGDSGDQSIIQRLVEIQNNLRALAPRVINLDRQVTGADNFDANVGPSVAGRLIAVQQALVGLGAPEVDPVELAASLAPLLGPMLAEHLDRLTDDDVARLAEAAADERDRRERERLGEAHAPEPIA